LGDEGLESGHLGIVCELGEPKLGGGRVDEGNAKRR
jgi:hypothetical protein